jgi:trans-2,3-dihydro-3-hydroxyanthranilate isomerase
MSCKLKKRYRVVDVFTDTPFEGNALAVFPDASGLDTGTMQKIAKELNLSETTFVFPATRSNCAANVKIFTPGQEMDFAGHPTIGTSYVLMEENIIPEGTENFILEERVGPIPIQVDQGPNPLIWLRTPPITSGMTFDRSVCARTLGLDTAGLLDITPRLLSAGNPTVFIALKDKEAVDKAWFNTQALFELKKEHPENFCVFLFAPTADGVYSRMFAHDYGVQEDPATGSSTGPLALYMMQNRLISKNSGTKFISEQGTRMGRRSVLYVHIRGDNGEDGIYVGGHVTPVAECVMEV